MIEILDRSEGNILAVRARGKLTDEDYEGVLIPKLEALFQTHGSARFLFLMAEDFSGWTSGGFWDYAKFGTKHQNHFEKVAAVGGPKWLEQWMKFKSYFVRAEIKTFPVESLEEAWTWIKS